MKTYKLLSALLLLSTLSLRAQTVNVLHSFTNNPDGEWPTAGLVFDQGMLYGVTGSGGSFGNGTIFKVSTNGSGFALLRSFTYSFDYTDGYTPQAGCNHLWFRISTA